MLEKPMNSLSHAETQVVSGSLRGDFEVIEFMMRKEYLCQRVLRGINVKELDVKHGADRVSLMKKLNALTEDDAGALLDAIGNFEAWRCGRTALPQKTEKPEG